MTLHQLFVIGIWSLIVMVISVCWLILRELPKSRQELLASRPRLIFEIYTMVLLLFSSTAGVIVTAVWALILWSVELWGRS